MKTYTFYYCLGLNCLGETPTEMFTVSASTYAIAFSRFCSFYSDVKSDYISFFRFYRIDSSNGKTSLRSFKSTSLTKLSEITEVHNNKEFDLYV